MPHIQALDGHVAELIAAGEVVERPASVVKELVENAIDAKASAVVVSIRRGGMGMIRVSDNGCGIAPEELPTAFLRHATSKLRTAEDLGKIGTLGFRGEALAAIAAVSRVDIQTRERGASTGAALHLEGGVCGQVEAAGAPEGTTITVQDLFYNTPARLKFMRKDSAETAAVAGTLRLPSFPWRAGAARWRCGASSPCPFRAGAPGPCRCFSSMAGSSSLSCSPPPWRRRTATS